MEAESSTEENHKKGRQRKKLLYNSILQQMEFYFSDSNLTKDRFLSQLINESEYVDVEVFLKFNKLRKITSSLTDIVKSLKKSEQLQLSEDETRVKRKTPIQVKTNTEECTVYVQHIKSDTTHERLKSIFADFGNVVYISIPKYRKNNLNKGFAFIEFEREQEARNTVEYFESIDCKISPQTAPEELRSIATFEQDGPVSDKMQKTVLSSMETDEDNSTEKEETKKRKLEDSQVQKEEKLELSSMEVGHSHNAGKEESKKRKRDDDESDIPEKKLKVDEDKEENGGQENDEVKRKKRKANKKKAQIKELGLQVLTKKEWRALRNRYLNMQREKMKELKRHLNKKRFGNKFEDRQKNEPPEQENVAVQKPKLEFVPGVIVHLKLKDPYTDSKKIKNDIKNSCPEAQYIEAPVTLNNNEVYIRFLCSESAKKFAQTSERGTSVVLGGEEETKYWDKIKSSRDTKLNKECKKQRGRDKLLKKAEKELGKHIRFDDNN